MGESFTGRMGSHRYSPRSRPQYMYCGLTNIMCAVRSLNIQTGSSRRHKSSVHVSEVVASVKEQGSVYRSAGPSTSLLLGKLEDGFPDCLLTETGSECAQSDL